MDNSSRRDYLPHRRQRPLADTTYEYAVLNHTHNKSRFRLPSSTRVVAIALGIIAGLSTVGTGALVLPWNTNPDSPRVAGVQTTEAYTPPPSTNPTNPTNPTNQNASGVCWNQVVSVDGQLHWRNSCRGLAPAVHRSCVARTLPLAPSELKAYQDWYYSDQVLPVACQAQPEELPQRNPLD